MGEYPVMKFFGLTVAGAIALFLTWSPGTAWAMDGASPDQLPSDTAPLTAAEKNLVTQLAEAEQAHQDLLQTLEQRERELDWSRTVLGDRPAQAAGESADDHVRRVDDWQRKREALLVGLDTVALRRRDAARAWRWRRSDLATRLAQLRTRANDDAVPDGAVADRLGRPIAAWWEDADIDEALAFVARHTEVPIVLSAAVVASRRPDLTFTAESITASETLDMLCRVLTGCRWTARADDVLITAKDEEVPDPTAVRGARLLVDGCIIDVVVTSKGAERLTIRDTSVQRYQGPWPASEPPDLPASVLQAIHAWRGTGAEQ